MWGPRKCPSHLTHCKASHQQLCGRVPIPGRPSRRPGWGRSRAASGVSAPPLPTPTSPGTTRTPAPILALGRTRRTYVPPHHVGDVVQVFQPSRARAGLQKAQTRQLWGEGHKAHGDPEPNWDQKAQNDPKSRLYLLKDRMGTEGEARCWRLQGPLLRAGGRCQKWGGLPRPRGLGLGCLSCILPEGCRAQKNPLYAKAPAGGGPSGVQRGRTPGPGWRGLCWARGAHGEGTGSLRRGGGGPARWPGVWGYLKWILRGGRGQSLATRPSWAFYIYVYLLSKVQLLRG